MFLTTLAMTLLLALATAVPAQDTPAEFYWPEAPVETFQAPCRTSAFQVTAAMCVMDGYGTGFGSVMVGYEQGRILMRAFIEESFVATDTYTDRPTGGLGELVANPQPLVRPPVDLPYEGYADCALYDPSSSFITHECVLNVEGLDGARIFVAHHESQLFASARVPDLGWAAGTVYPDQSYLPAGNYYE